MTQPTKPKRSEGQWALGDRDPLNVNEEFKKEDPALNVRARIENIYAKQGFDSIDKTDLRGRLRWWGLYTQRKEGFDGTFTGEENVDLIEAPYFMLRVRSDGGALSAAALRTLGEISREFARDTADISDRQNIQYHWIRIEDMPEIWRRLEAVGLQTTEACGDCPRVVLGSPLAGESLDEVIDATPAIDEIVRRYVGKPEYANLPRKFKTAISGLQDVVHEINDVAFVGVDHPEHGPGLDLWVGGGLSTNPMLAQRLGAWVPLDEVPDVWEAVVSLFRDYGYRRLRAKARLKFLVKDWGVAEVPRSSRNRIPQAATDRRPRARPRRASDRPRRRAATAQRAQRRWRGRDRRTGVGHHPDSSGRYRREGGFRPDPVHPAPEAHRARRSRRPASMRWSRASTHWASPRPRRSGGGT